MAVAEVAAKRAAHIVLEARPRILATNSVKQKDAGEGPVTEADLAADEVIREHIKDAFPADTIISEESFTGVGNAALSTKGRVWLVDPLDGTKCFINPNSSDFCIMIGLLIDGFPAAGLIVEPTTGRAWKGVNGLEYSRAWHTSSDGSTRQLPSLPDSRTEGVLSFGAGPPVSPKFAELISEFVHAPARAVSKGSAGLKAMLIVDGETEMYTSGCQQISVWDVCAGHAILNAVGGGLCTLALAPINYQRRQLRDGLFFHAPGINDELKMKVRGMYEHLAKRRGQQQQR
eukprot:CAMPEP_0198198300 /NCGR_PEP_ID=MMETSP1445-20131203/1788_1 /TAXON_ID=36898 /ORGANISM="Pyramimonas sp., Strain CCMP2087" /LENGTH=287 /DNA_ID=CAMNT_0043867825 /DNA_START=436 /DNA_END=1299 /DNA_ORIENTATION=+